MKDFKKIFNPGKLSTLLFYLNLFTFIISFNFAHNPPSGWYQQFLPNLGGSSIVDITFTDSLNGYAITTITSDTSYILKTTNGGDDWIVIHGEGGFIMKSIDFLNENTGYVGGTNLITTSNGGTNWFSVNNPVPVDDIDALNVDTIWTVYSEGLTGGVFRTTNGGTNWEQQLHLGSQNPNHIYMYNGRIGFTSTGNGTYKTTNSGVNWFNLQVTSFSDIYFSDSLTGWKNNQVATIIQKTTDGGMNWINQTIPKEGGNIFLSRINNFENINSDTIWGVGGQYQYSFGVLRGMIYLTTDGGQNWGYQLTDSSIHISRFLYTNFVNKLNGWAYTTIPTGVHTKTGGNDTTYYTNINSITNINPNNFKLSQNYPNPFNPETIIGYQLFKFNDIKLKVYNVTGNEVMILVNKKQSAGNYKVKFDGSFLPGGVYFYSLFIDGMRVDTKKMVLLR